MSKANPGVVRQFAVVVATRVLKWALPCYVVYILHEAHVAEARGALKKMFTPPDPDLVPEKPPTPPTDDSGQYI